MATFRHNNNEGEVRPSDDECLVRRRSASVLEVKNMPRIDCGRTSKGLRV